MTKSPDVPAETRLYGSRTNTITRRDAADALELCGDGLDDLRNRRPSPGKKWKSVVLILDAEFQEERRTRAITDSPEQGSGPLFSP